MADARSVKAGEHSPERVAYDLMVLIARAEGRKLQWLDSLQSMWLRLALYFRLRSIRLGPAGERFLHQRGRSGPDRDWVLDTYAECLIAVRDPYARSRRVKLQPTYDDLYRRAG